MTATSNTRFAVAVHVLTYLADVAGDHPVSSDELAASTNSNPVHVRRVLGPLREAGVVTARSGSRGGWGLGRPAADIDLAAVWDVVHGAESVLALHDPNPACPVGRGVVQVLADVDEQAAAAVRATLAARTVADVVTEAAARAGAAPVSR